MLDVKRSCLCVSLLNTPEDLSTSPIHAPWIAFADSVSKRPRQDCILLPGLSLFCFLLPTGWALGPSKWWCLFPAVSPYTPAQSQSTRLPTGVSSSCLLHANSREASNNRNVLSWLLRPQSGFPLKPVETGDFLASSQLVVCQHSWAPFGYKYLSSMNLHISVRISLHAHLPPAWLWLCPNLPFVRDISHNRKSSLWPPS